MNHLAPLTTTLALTFALTTSVGAQDWPAFRGPDGTGEAPAQKVPTTWSHEKNVKWRVPLPRPANGSPIVSGGRVFLTCPEDEAGKRRSLLCFDRANGKKLWTRTVKLGKKMPTHRTNPYGGTTPAADGERVVVWHASAGLHCYDFDGEEIWKRDFGEFRHEWGYGTSPVLHDGKVILHSGPGAHVFVAAFDLESGKTIWKTDEPVHGDGQRNAEKKFLGSWCTPLIATVDGRTQILCTMATRLVSYDPDDGKILWTCGGLPCKNGDLAYSSPSIAGDVCLILGGFEGPEIGVRLDKNRGDVTGTHRLWRQPRRPSNCGSGVVVDGMLYIPDMRGVLACVDPKSGERLWSTRSTKGAIWSSIVKVNGLLFVTNQSGTTIVFRPNPKKLEVVSENRIPEKTNATPAISNGEIFLRTHERLYCIGV
jgi:outer membrane protein assembly factor BamB